MHYVCYVNNWIVDKDWKIFDKQFMDMKEYWNFLKSDKTLSLKTYIYIDTSVTIIILNCVKGIRESTIIYVGRNINNQATVGRTWS